MQTKHLFLLPALAFLACAGLQAQVTIGGVTDPTAGALLDLNSTGGVRGGLLLSNVALTKMNVIPQSFPGVTSANYNTPAVKSNFRGAMVYHTGGNDIPAGIYIWSGFKWIPPGGDPNVSFVYDAEGHKYTTGYFGNAGWWMTQNLRSTQYDDGNGTGETLDAEASTDATHKRYTYPGVGNSHTGREEALTAAPELLEAYGLLYSWAAASGRTDASSGMEEANNPSQTEEQGICPKEWHLPSDWEWSELEKEIATYPQKYSSSEADAYFTASTTDYGNLYTGLTLRPNSDGGTNVKRWGRQMKSTTGVPSGTASNSSSFPREAGGFDALLVGYVLANGTTSSYGSDAYFWSSSSYSSGAMGRHLVSGYTDVGRTFYNRPVLFSVRCKKD
jgi:uncharacterized protein (TIGR02145 family)